MVSTGQRISVLPTQQSSSLRTVSVIGLGYIGLPTAAILANHGIQVIGVDINEAICDRVNAGISPVIEEGFAKLVATAVDAQQLKATTRPEPADAFIIAVPTPILLNREPDLRFIQSAALALAPVLKSGDLVILESTSPVGTTRQLAHWLAEQRPDLTFPHQLGEDADIRLAYCPERIIPGNMLAELCRNDRIVGGMTPRCAREAASLYEIFVTGTIKHTTDKVAEMVKLAENAYRDVSIAFANELSMICDAQDVDAWDVIALANRHPRVNILNPGPGVGGQCIAVDPWFIVAGNPELSPLIRTAREVNDAKAEYVFRQIRDAVLHGKNQAMACFGLSYKANVDDFRESPAVNIVAKLADAFPERTIFVVDPFAEMLPPALAEFKNLMLVAAPEALHHANIVAMLVGHDAFRALSAFALADKTRIDTCGFWR